MSYELSYNARDKLFSIHNSLQEAPLRKSFEECAIQLHHYTPQEIIKNRENNLNNNKNNSNGNDEMMVMNQMKTNSINSRISMDLSTGYMFQRNYESYYSKAIEEENFITLKTTLPLIRYFHLSITEIFDKITLYKKILDKKLWKDINQNMAAPDRPVKSIILPARSILVTKFQPRTKEPKEHFSTIISEEHAAEISSWIDRKTTTCSATNIPYKFELILIVIAKVKGTDEILGGYNPLAWDNSNIDGKWVETKDSFIFSLKNDNIGHCDFNRYERPIRTTLLFSIVNYEVFKITGKS
ncbi:hypothetical protein Glove_13g67 [Diversispora epigaea]|uniref:TLDc domain-containing protein n=1 Tax=Diversispora epigaea TaxID=1348612 RepID=A0A397JPC3_9GLOM|nr:hypothetical protein Glove_13g67 [Diversispora epigaea]